MEMVAQPVVHQRHFIVDVVSFRDSKLYAWEYKSKGDHLTNAILQCENYVKSFDFVCVAVEDFHGLDSLVRKRGLYVKTILKQMGVGVFVQDEWGKFDKILDPVQQSPMELLHEKLMKKFRRYVFNEIPQKPKPKLPERNWRNFELTEFMDPLKPRDQC